MDPVSEGVETGGESKGLACLLCVHTMGVPQVVLELGLPEEGLVADRVHRLGTTLKVGDGALPEFGGSDEALEWEYTYLI